jgi:hypothetical protein
MKPTLSLLIFLLSFSGLTAQNTVKITGKITDPEGKPISSASVALYHAASAEKSSAGTVSNSEGLFILSIQPETSALLKIKHLVFEDEDIRIQLLGDTALNVILTPKSHLLGEVAVTGARPRYRIKDDGNMVVSVERIPGSETNSVFDLMKKLPGVIATEDQGISLHGKNVEIMVDNRRMPYMNMLTLLKSLPAHSLNEIELISIKGAEYDADSQEAIINLKTKQQRLEGYFGNVGALGRAYFNGSYVDAGNVFFMLKAKKTAFSTTLSYEDYKVKGSGENTTFLDNTDKTIVRAGSQQDKEQHYSSNSTFSWDIKNGHSLYANLLLFGGQLDRKETSNYVNNINHTSVRTLTGRDAPRLLVSGNVEYRLGSLFTANYGYVRGKSGYDEDIENTYPLDSMVSVIHNENNLESQHTGKIDFKKQMGKLTVRSGLKGTFSRQENSSIYTAEVPVSYQDMDFTANENIMGGYIGLDYKISDKVNATIASRIEHTDYSIENRQLFVAVNPSYWNYFPSGRITVKARTWYMFTAYFNSGLARPRYQSLLPGKRYIDDYTYMEGNPNLKPAQYYTLALQNIFLNIINVSLDATVYKNNTGSIRIDMGNGISANTYMNAVDSRTFGASVSTPFSMLKEKLQGNINFSAKTGEYMNERNGYVLPARRIRPQSVKLSGFFNYQLTPAIGITSNVLYSAINRALQTEYTPYATLDLGVNMNLLKSKRLSASLNVADVFNSKKSRYKVYYSNNLFINDIAIPSQYVGLNISYRFNGGKQFNPKINAEGNDTGRFTK